MCRKIVAIHQPDFFPWLGFFNKIVNSDIFIILDHVENNPRDASFFGRRVKLLINGQEYWFSIPLIKEQGRLGIPINKMIINISDKKMINKRLITVNQNYKKAPFYQEIMPYVEDYFLNESPFISERNFLFIKSICKKLKLETKMEFSSNLFSKYASTELLVDLIKKVNGNTYLYGGSGESYQDKDKFLRANIELVPQNFQYPEYKQFNSIKFIKDLSIIDALMNLGFKGVRKLLKIDDLSA